MFSKLLSQLMWIQFRQILSKEPFNSGIFSGFQIAEETLKFGLIWTEKCLLKRWIEIQIFFHKTLNFGNNGYFLKKTTMLDAFCGKCGKNCWNKNFLLSLFGPRAIVKSNVKKPKCWANDFPSKNDILGGDNKTRFSFSFELIRY